MTAGGRAAAMVVASAAAAVLTLLLLAGGAYADCYADCFKDCMNKLNQRDYCNYACDKVCYPDADATLHQHPLAAVVGPAALLTDHRRHPVDKKEDDAAVRPAALPDHPFHETHGYVVEPDPRHVVRPARVPVLP